jgi:hypothetical protein
MQGAFLARLDQLPRNSLEYSKGSASDSIGPSLLFARITPPVWRDLRSREASLTG